MSAVAHRGEAETATQRDEPSAEQATAERKLHTLAAAEAAVQRDVPSAAQATAEKQRRKPEAATEIQRDDPSAEQATAEREAPQPEAATATWIEEPSVAQATAERVLGRLSAAQMLRQRMPTPVETAQLQSAQTTAERARAGDDDESVGGIGKRCTPGQAEQVVDEVMRKTPQRMQPVAARDLHKLDGESATQYVGASRLCTAGFVCAGAGKGPTFGADGAETCTLTGCARPFAARTQRLR